ncbi:MAG: helix-turn-helix domain-containing protein [Planctomycetes bacterium]|nr:helix-turn-helix domain-containing protein [Planctomycetota bacterium]
MDKLLKEPEVLALLGISSPTLWRLRKRGQLRAVQIGSAIRYRRQDVEQLVELSRERPSPRSPR